MLKTNTKQHIKLHLSLLWKLGLLVIGGLLIITFITQPNDKHMSTEKTYGIAVGNSFPYMKQNAIMSELLQIKSLGFTEVRFDVPWDLIQPKNEHTYDWSKFDAIFSDIHKSNLKALPILDRVPYWARPIDCSYSFECEPANPAQFAQYSASVVKRYQSKDILAWEIWNEPNTATFWKPVPDPKAYYKLLSATYRSIKKEDKNSPVLLGGLSGSTGDGDKFHMDPRTFLSDLYADGGKDFFDGVAYHPYTNLNLPNNSEPNNGWSKMESLNPSLRSIMIANGDKNKKIWITEIGAPTNGPGTITTGGVNNLNVSGKYVSEQVQAQIAQQVLSDIKHYDWVNTLFWYSYKDAGVSTSTTENFYGLVRNNGTPKPAYQVFKSIFKQ